MGEGTGHELLMSSKADNDGWVSKEIKRLLLPVCVSVFVHNLTGTAQGEEDDDLVGHDGKNSFIVDTYLRT